jgi:hypothetical protein
MWRDVEAQVGVSFALSMPSRGWVIMSLVDLKVNINIYARGRGVLYKVLRVANVITAMMA